MSESSDGTVLVIDDEKNIRRTLAMVLEGEGLDVVDAGSAEEGLQILSRRKVDAVVLDVCLPGMDGLTALRAILEDERDLPVVMISGHASIQDAVEATRLGAFDFLEKPLSRDRVLLTLRNCLRRGRDARELSKLRAEAGRRRSSLLGEAPVMVRLREQIAKVAPTRGRVLITGESGTGKELIAREIHEQSDRAERPFEKVNCAAIPHDLIESTLFGHEKGAFTSAVGRRRGHFELAHTGTLFLDEIGDMALSAQAKVLRVLQTGEMTRVGGEQPVAVDVRVIAATNKDLAAAVKAGEFREDLYFRLNVVPLVSPPLRARAGDVPMLVEHFLAEVCAENGFRSKRVHPEVIGRLCVHDWPGNVRELRNVVERLAILSGEIITLADVPADLGGRASVSLGPSAVLPDEGTLRDFRETAEREFIVARLEQHEWNISRAADSLGLERTNLHKKMKALGIERPS
ncbi:MAG: sigma-54-dependent Fis family transcriptional regulator [Myxococcales bacterium]|nr:sigma-54-dependent Fis family transcriptional regulator [Myxococcales bacterium]